MRYFIVEDVRSARRFLRLIDKKFPIDDSVFTELNEHTPDSEIPSHLQVIKYIIENSNEKIKFNLHQN